MSRKTSLCFAVAAVISLAMATDSQAFWGSRGSSGSCGSSGGSWGSSGGSSGGGWGSSGGSSGSSGSHGGFLGRIFNHGGSCGSSGGYSSCGSSGGSSGSNGSSGGAAYYGGDGGYYTSVSRPATYAVASAAAPVKTQLTLRVPADAKVTLAGVATKQTGEVRQFTTSNLASGQAWQNYQVVVEMNRDGKTVREERTITLVGGQAQDLSLGANDAKLARLTP